MSGPIDSPETSRATLDDELAAIGPDQLDTFDQMQRLPGLYTSRIVEQVEFISEGGQAWERQVQLRIPAPVSDAGGTTHQRYIVSLGRFERRRFADFSVVRDDGGRCHLLSRRQHGHCLAIGLLRPFFTDAEFAAVADDDNLRALLERLRSYLADMVTTMKPTTDFSPQGAQILFDALLVGLEIDLHQAVAASAVFVDKCSAALVGTQYLCWVDAPPDGTVHLTATYTQADLPSTTDEGDIHRPKLANPLVRRLRRAFLRGRLWWRNRRTGIYVRYNLFPVRYNFATPAYEHCGSYYFTISPPADTQVIFFDWERGRRFAQEPRGLFSRRSRATATALPSDGIHFEVDCANYAYHFHNRRLPGRSGIVPADRRASRRASGITLRAFLRSEPTDNGRLVALGFLSLGLAAAAGTGDLYSTSNSSGASQWLLLAPAVLTLFVTQQRQHHYAYLTRPFRTLVWLYIVVAMGFAATTALGYDSAALSTGATRPLPRILSGVFVVASILVIIAFSWSGEHFEQVVQRRYYRVMRRVHIFGNPSFGRTLVRHRWQPRYWRLPRKPLPESAVDPDRREDHPSHKVFAGVARHAIDRVLLATALLLVAAVGFMLADGWGEKETCAIGKLRLDNLATERGQSPRTGRCVAGAWVSKPRE